ncbi:MAG: hypothetical protein LUQ69_10245 [Methanoregulaceae archaeon]|nr:hypothetical protein [Methanoregulaceae archaeon]
MAAWAVGPTAPQLAAFQALAGGNTQWPVYRVETGSLVADGKLAEPQWESAYKIYMSAEWMWALRYTGYEKDALTRWRMLYDDEALYIACEFFDDVHMVDSTGAEPWTYNDGLEITLFPQNVVVPLADTLIYSRPFLRFLRRFTDKEGLFGFAGNAWVPRDPGRYGWAEPEPEGSDRLGGVVCRAQRMFGSCPAYGYPGAWVMEIRIPLKAFINMDTGVQDGQIFKMNYAFTDDDSVRKIDPYVVKASAHRYPAWWGSDTTQSVYRFCPTFMLAGFKGNSSSPRFNPPLESDLYCTVPPQVLPHAYELAIYQALAVCSNGVENKIEWRGNSGLLIASPNPFRSASEIRFTIPGQEAAFKVFDMRGLVVRDLGLSGTGRVFWDGRNSSGLSVAPGNYVLRMDAGKESRNLKLTVMK